MAVRIALKDEIVYLTRTVGGIFNLIQPAFTMNSGTAYNLAVNGLAKPDSRIGIPSKLLDILIIFNENLPDALIGYGEQEVATDLLDRSLASQQVNEAQVYLNNLNWRNNIGYQDERLFFYRLNF